MYVLLCGFICLFPLNVFNLFVYAGGSQPGIFLPCGSGGTFENGEMFSCPNPVGGGQ